MRIFFLIALPYEFLIPSMDYISIMYYVYICALYIKESKIFHPSRTDFYILELVLSLSRMRRLTLLSPSFFKKIIKFVYLLWERERGRESQPGSTLSAQSLMQGLNSQTMRSWPELKSRSDLTYWATQVPLLSPSAPASFHQTSLCISCLWEWTQVFRELAKRNLSGGKKHLVWTSWDILT